MLDERPFLIKPEGNPTIWRYLTLDKFENLLNSKSIYLCRSDLLKEPYEGSIPRKEYEHRQNSDMSDMSTFTSDFRKKVYVNCWQINQFESDAMWKLYLNDYNGIAVMSNYLRLVDVCSEVKESDWSHPLNETDQKIGISKIRYIDFDKNIYYHKTEFPHLRLNMSIPFIHKRIEFSHENELRIMITSHYKNGDNSPKGIQFGVNLVKLIDQIILPPKYSDGFKKRIEEMIRDYDFHFNVRNSKMNEQVYF